MAHIDDKGEVGGHEEGQIKSIGIGRELGKV